MRARQVMVTAALIALTVNNAAYANDGYEKAGWIPPSKHGLAYKLTHMGLVHKTATVLGAPFWVVGFTVPMVGGLVVIPFKRGYDHFRDEPFVEF